MQNRLDNIQPVFCRLILLPENQLCLTGCSLAGLDSFRVSVIDKIIDKSFQLGYDTHT